MRTRVTRTSCASGSRSVQPCPDPSCLSTTARPSPDPSADPGSTLDPAPRRLAATRGAAAAEAMQRPPAGPAARQAVGLSPEGACAGRCTGQASARRTTTALPVLCAAGRSGTRCLRNGAACMREQARMPCTPCTITRQASLHTAVTPQPARSATLHRFAAQKLPQQSTHRGRGHATPEMQRMAPDCMKRACMGMRARGPGGHQGCGAGAGARRRRRGRCGARRLRRPREARRSRRAKPHALLLRAPCGGLLASATQRIHSCRQTQWRGLCKHQGHVSDWNDKPGAALRRRRSVARPCRHVRACMALIRVRSHCGALQQAHPRPKTPPRVGAPAARAKRRRAGGAWAGGRAGAAAAAAARRCRTRSRSPRRRCQRRCRPPRAAESSARARPPA